MTRLIWDDTGERRYESGVDRGVIYWTRPGFVHPAVVWNGLKSVDDQSETELKSFYQDGVKYLDYLVQGDFSAKVKAFTYPDELDYLSGSREMYPGLWFMDQKPRIFGMCYRTMLGDDVSGPNQNYRLHLVYNIKATPDTKAYSSMGDSVDPVEFGWTFTARPIQTGTTRPVTHIVIDSKATPPELLTLLEETLYGNESLPAVLPTYDYLLEIFDAYTP